MFATNPATRTAARAMIAEREALNAQHGASDGRVTEINYLRELLPTLRVAILPQRTATPRRRPVKSLLARANFSVHYTDAEGYKKTRHYITEEGLDKFLSTADARGFCVLAYA